MSPRGAQGAIMPFPSGESFSRCARAAGARASGDVRAVRPSSLEPVVARTHRPLSELAFEPALATQPGTLVGAGAGVDGPGRRYLAVVDRLGALKNKQAAATNKQATEALHAD